MKHKHFNRLLSMLLAVATLFGLLTLPANAATLKNSGTVTIQQAGYGKYLTKSTGGTIGGGYWRYTSNDGLTGTAYCVNHGLKGVSPSKALTVQEYNRNPKTMGAFASGYPNRTLEQFKELHASDVRGIASLTEDEYKYATQLAIWATCGQLAVPDTSFTAGRETLAVPTADAQKIRIFDSVKAILKLSEHWTKNLYTGLSIRADENRDVRGVEVMNENGLKGAAADGEDGIKKETIGGKEYYTRVLYVASATSTWIDERKTKVYSTDAPQGTIFVAENNSPLETTQENGATCYLVDTSRQHNTNLNSNGSEYYGTFKVCLPVDNVPDEGNFTIKTTGGVAQYNLFLAYNPAASEQSYIISDPGYTTLEAQLPFKWSGIDETTETASLQVVKAGAGGAPLEGAEFTLTGTGGTTVSGTTDHNGQIVWRDLPADEKYTLTETAAPEGYQIVAPMNVTLTPGRTEYMTVTDETEKGFTIKKVDAQNNIFHLDPSTVDPSGPTELTANFDDLSATVSACIQNGYDAALARVEQIITTGGYDHDLSMEALINNGLVSTDYDTCYTLAAYSASLEQKGISKSDLQAKLQAVSGQMYAVTYEEKETQVTVPAETEGGEPTVENVKYVVCTIHPFDQAVILTAFGIDTDAQYSQFSITYGEAITNMSNALKMTMYGTLSNGMVPPITDIELNAYLNSLTCSGTRKELMRAALSLVGRVPYFWGGKSAPGWNDAWNTPRLVTSAGSSSTGTIRPYGLDCSGFTDWVYKTALGVSLLTGSWSQWDSTYAITEAELLPGDIGFMAVPGTVPVNHVLLYAGRDADGKQLWVHCSSSAGGVALNSPTYVTQFRRRKDIDLEADFTPVPIEQGVNHG